MKYPKSVLTKSKSGKLEVRWLIDRGRFVRYKYIDPQTGKQLKRGTIKLVLKSSTGYEHYFVVPLKDGRALLLSKGSHKPKGKIWNSKKAIKYFTK